MSGEAVPVPILKLGRVLVVPIQAELTDSAWREFRSALLDRAGQHASTGVVIDVSAMQVIDSYAGRSLSELAQMLSLRGVRMAVAGIQPDVAYSMVQLGLELPNARTVLDVEDGLEVLESTTATDPSGSER